MRKLLTKNFFYIITGLFLVIAVVGAFDSQANLFVSKIAKKNISFLALVSEVKLIMASIKGIQIPFISGSSDEINTALGKAQNYLLLTNITVFLQLLLLGVSKSWLVKIGMITCFFLNIIQKSNRFYPKLLILVLALNPGFSIYSVMVEQLSKEASIDFGNEYLQELKMQVQGIKEEKAKMMQEHAQQINRINNEEKGIVFLKKLKEDVSYDIKKGVESIKGDYAKIRLLYHEAGHTMVKKLFTFCTMILFYLLLLPIGYVLFIYYLSTSLFKTHSGNSTMQDVQNPLETSKSLLTKASNSIKAVKQEFPNEMEQIEKEAFEVKSNINDQVEGFRKEMAEGTSDLVKKVVDYVGGKEQLAVDQDHQPLNNSATDLKKGKQETHDIAIENAVEPTSTGGEKSFSLPL